jgi:hypothetical protein
MALARRGGISVASNFFDQFDAPTDTASAPVGSYEKADPDTQAALRGENLSPSFASSPSSSSSPSAAPTKPVPNFFDQFDVASHPARSSAPQPAEPSVASDVGRGAGLGAIKGVGMILGFPSDVWQMLDRGYQWTATKAAEKMGLITPEQGAQLRQPLPGLEDYQAGSEKINEHLLGLARSAGADTSEPRTVPGQYAETAASFVPSAVALGASSAKDAGRAALRYGVLPAVTSETAGQATKGTALEPYARVAGAIAPEGLIQATGAAGRAMSPLNRALDGVSDADMTAAQSLVDQSRAAGAPLTLPEAIQHVTGGATRLGDIQRVVEQSPAGAAKLRPFMAQRPGQADALARSTFDQIAPAGSDPYQIGPRIQGAAQQVIEGSPETSALRQATDALGPNTSAEEAGSVIRPELQNIYDRREGMRNALANEDYGASRAADYTTNGEAANPVQVRPVIDHIDDQLTTAKGATAMALRRARATLFSNGQPDMSVTGLSNARNAIASQVSMASRAGNTDVARVLGPNGVLGQLDSALEEVPAYGQARRNFARASEPLTPFADDTAPGRIIDRDQFGNNYTMPTEKVAPTIERGGPSAADQFLAAAENSPRARAAFGQYYSRQLLGSATDAAGRINPNMLADTLRDNQDMLRRFPEISANLNRIGAARSALQMLEKTPIGAVAQTGGKTAQEQFQAQRNLLFNPTTALAGGERVIGSKVASIAAHDPEAAQQFVRQHLEQAFNEAAQNNVPGANQFGAPKFAAMVAGNSQQAKNLEAAVRALPDGNVRWNALRKGLDIMEGMGARQPVGSQTAFNAQINKWMQQGHPAAEFLADAASPGQWPGLVKRAYEHVMYNRNTGELARVFTEGNVDELRDIARAGRRSFQGQAALIGALARQGASSGQPARSDQSGQP